MTLSAAPMRRSTPIGVLTDLLVVADELLLADQVDYGPALAAAGAGLCRLSDDHLAAPAWHLLHQALGCLWRAPEPERWRWIAVVASLRDLVERDLERLVEDAEAPHGRMM